MFYEADEVAPGAMDFSATYLRVTAVIVTHNRPALLKNVLAAVLGQQPPPHEIIVVDNASDPDTAATLDRYPSLVRLRLETNSGGAGGFRTGIECAVRRGADWLWLMDDDGRPAASDCLARLLQTGRDRGAEMVGALVVDIDAPDRLAFPIRISGRTLFNTAAVAQHGTVSDFAHLFNGALIAANLIRRIGLPEARFFIRGDEVEFLYRARRARTTIVLDTGAYFLHPGSHDEIHAILGGLYYAVVPPTAVKRFYQFRNRGFIFSRYGMWGWLVADIVRYGLYFLVTRRGDLPGFWGWMSATATGLRGRFMCPAQTSAH